MKFFKPAVNLINRLRYSQKLILLGTIITCVILVLFYKLAIDSYQNIKFTKVQLLGINLNNELIDIFEKLQKYRYIEKKTPENQAELLTLQVEIVRGANKLNDDLKNLELHSDESQIVKRIKDKVATIKDKIDNISTKNAIADDVSDLMILVCDASNLTLDYELDTSYLAYSYCTQFASLSLNETLIRNLGEDVLAKRSISKDTINKLYATRLLILEYNLVAIKESEEKAFEKKPDLKNIIEPLKNELIEAINLSMALLENSILNEKFDIKPEEFSKQYNALIQTTNQFHKKTGDVLTNRLNLRMQELKKEFYIELTIVISSLLLLIYLFIGIYLSIVVSIYRLTKGAQKISKGSLSEKVELETHDESSEIAASFNEMREMLLNVVQKLHEVVTDANRGKLNNIINLAGAEGFYKELFNEINQMTSTFNDVIVDLSSVLDFMSKGNLTKKMTHHYEGSFEDLKTYMNHTVESLEVLLKEIKTATTTISHAVKEIVLGNNDLAIRTDQQAAALEETSASMEKITNTVKQNTENAKGVNDLAKSTSVVALKGGAAVNQAVEMMNSINANIHEVSEISNVIDNIAFQTNILALNASVEAARAGEQGRGFSVVATEIRNLALRSADSAKNIKTLINTTIERIARGAKLVDEAGQTITEVVSSVNNVTDIMSKMANATIEQSHGIEQIYVSINQIDLVTQQNSALVEEAARSSESLEQQIKHVDHLVDVFTVTAEGKKTLSQTNNITQKHNFPAKPDEWKEF